MLHDSSIFVKKILRRFASRQDTTKTNYENNEYCSDSAIPLPEKTNPTKWQSSDTSGLFLSPVSRKKRLS